MATRASRGQRAEAVPSKNIQVFDPAVNAVYDVFAATEADFVAIFPNGTDVAFIDEVIAAVPQRRLSAIFRRLWKRRIQKCDAMGIHGLLFYGLDTKKPFYPTRKDEQAINPDGSRLRQGGAWRPPD